MATPVVLDMGSDCSKVGFTHTTTTTTTPQLIFPSLLGRIRSPSALLPGQPEWYSGLDAELRRGVLHTTHPIRDGVVLDWEGFERLLTYAFAHPTLPQPITTDVGVEHPVMVTDAMFDPQVHHGRFAELFFETFQAPHLSILHTAAAALHATGATSGVVWECGDQVSRCVPVVEGVATPQATQQFAQTGNGLTTALVTLLGAHHIYLTTTRELMCAKKMKERLCRVSQYPVNQIDDDAHHTTSLGGAADDTTTTWTLPDGEVITLHHEPMMCAETLFDFNITPLDGLPIHHVLSNTIMHCDKVIPKHHLKEVCSKVVLAGGATLLPGLSTRLQHELNAIMTIPPQVITSQKYSTWVGASICATMSTWDWTSKPDYEEFGANIFVRK